MALSFKGHAPDFQYWVFNIDGRDWVAVNQSTPQPLKIQFQGRYRAWPASLPLIKTSGFDIISGTTSKSNDLGEKQGTVEWLWAGNRYKSSWVTVAGNEVAVADPEEGIPAEFDYQLNFIGMVPYEGPVTGPVGTGIESEATKQARKEEQASTEAVSDTKDSLDAANRALAVSEAQRKVDLQALNTARVEIENAKKSLADAQAAATANQQVLLAQMQERLEEMQERANIQINIYRQMLAQQQAPPATVPPATVPPVTVPPVTVPPATTPPATVPSAPTTAPSGTDWVKLGLQLGAAYLILS